MISFTTTKQTQALIGTIVGPANLALDAVYNPPPGKKPDIQKIGAHLASIGPALALLLDEDFIKQLSEEWHKQLYDAVGTVVTELVPLLVNATKLVVHFAQPAKP